MRRQSWIEAGTIKLTTLIAHNCGKARSLEARFYLQGRSGYLELRYYHRTSGIDGDKYTSVCWRIPEGMKSFNRIETESELEDEITHPGMTLTFLAEAIPVKDWISFAEETDNLHVARLEFGDGSRVVCDFYAWDSFVERLVNTQQGPQSNVLRLVQGHPTFGEGRDFVRGFMLQKPDDTK